MGAEHWIAPQQSPSEGKIAAYDSRVPGGASNDMRFLYYNPKLGPKFIQKLFGEMEIAIAADRRYRHQRRGDL